MYWIVEILLFMCVCVCVCDTGWS